MVDWVFQQQCNCTLAGQQFSILNGNNSEWGILTDSGKLVPLTCHPYLIGQWFLKCHSDPSIFGYIPEVRWCLT